MIQKQIRENWNENYYVMLKKQWKSIMPLIAMLLFLSFYVVDETSFLSLIILYIYYRDDVFVFDDDICYDYGDFSASILSSILSKSICLIKKHLSCQDTSLV